MTTACGSYDVSLNNQILYEPPLIITVKNISDVNLTSCINQTLLDEKITALNQLTRLSCTYAGITSLEGLQQFEKLKEINLSNNEVRDILAVFAMENLDTLHISGNPELRCSQLASLKSNSPTDIFIKPPSHCKTQ